MLWEWGVHSNEQEKMGFLVKIRKRNLEALLISIILFYVSQGAKIHQKTQKTRNKKNSMYFVICQIGKEHLSGATVLGIYVGLIKGQKQRELYLRL